MSTSTTDGAGGPGGQPVEADDLAALDRAISALEAQRTVLGDDVVDTALLPLQERRTRLVEQRRTEQRKLVTVVFADLVEFTDLSGRLDAEDVRDIVDAYFTRWRRAIESHQGVVEKFIGDAVMAVFGLHRAYEDDAERAVRAALSMVGDLEALNAEVERRHGVTLRMRVGVDSGDVVVSTLGDRGETQTGAFVAVGPTVNRAARLQAAAPPDRIMVSAETYRQVRGRFSMERVDGLVLKGFDEPVTGYLAVSERPHTFRLDRSAGVEGVETSTVGREAEMRQLQERLLDVVEESRWRVVTVVGEAGIGKSRLLFDFDSWLAERPERFYWYRGRASHADHDRANALLRDVVASRCSIVDSDSAAEVLDKLDTGLADAFEEEGRSREVAYVVGAWLGFHLGELPAAVPRDPQALRDAGTELLAEYFATRSRRYPVVILLEDLHWADDGSLRWLDAADTWLRDCPVLVVATTRPTLLEERPRWSEGLAHHDRVAVPPLSRRQARSLLQQLFRHVDSVPEQLVELVIDSAEGNPFYIEELVTWLIEAGVVVKGDPTWHVAEELVGSVVVPATLRGVLQARLDALSTEERTVLQRASVVGRVFWDDAVARLGRHLRARPEGTSGALDTLRRRDLVLEREVSAFEEAREFLFKHALLRDVAYEGVLRSHRERYHRLAAEWLAEMSARSGRDDEYAALVALHFDRAGDERAAHWYFRAGRRASDVYALDEATRLLGRALALLPAGATRFDVLRLREAIWDRLGEREHQRADLEELAELLADLGEDPPRQVAFELARCRLGFNTSDYDEAETWAHRAMSTAQDHPSLGRELVDAHLWLGKSQTWRDHGEQARASLGRALELGREHGTGRQVGEALRYLSMLANNEGRYAEAVDLGTEAAEEFRRDGDPEGEAMALSQQATTYFHLGRLQEAKETLQRTLPVFRRSGHRYREAVALGNLASVALTQGQVADAQAWASQATEVHQRLGDVEATVNNQLLLGEIAMAVGSWETAAGRFREALASSRQLDTRQPEVFAYTRLAILAVERGEPAQAAEPVAAALDLARSVASPMERASAAMAAGYARHAVGSHEEAVEHFLAAEREFGRLEAQVQAREARAGRAGSLLALGHVGEAAALVHDLLPHLDREGVDGACRPTALLGTVWRVLEAAGDPGAHVTFEAALAYLDDTLLRIGDDTMRAGYLAVPVNAELVATRVARGGRAGRSRPRSTTSG